MHIWVDGVPVVKKKKTEVVKPVRAVRRLGEGVEGLDKLRTMQLVGSHIYDTSTTMKMQNKIPNTAEYNFSVRNTDSRNKSMGTARKLYVDVELPAEAKLEDAYFY